MCEIQCIKMHGETVRQCKVFVEAFCVKCSNWLFACFLSLIVPCAVFIAGTAGYYLVVTFVHYQCLCLSH